MISRTRVQSKNVCINYVVDALHSCARRRAMADARHGYVEGVCEVIDEHSQPSSGYPTRTYSSTQAAQSTRKCNASHVVQGSLARLSAQNGDAIRG